MKLNIAFPDTGCQKTIEVDDEKKLRIFYDKRISAEVEADPLGDEFKGYVFRISGGFDKQGFPMMQGVLLPHRVRLLLNDNHPCYRARRSGERKRRSVRGCIVAADISVLHLIVVRKGEGEIEGLTDKIEPKRLGPKRANNIRKLFALSKEDDVRKYVIRREIPAKGDRKAYTKAPKIQRLVTPLKIQRRRARRAVKRNAREKTQQERQEYAKMIHERNKSRRQEHLSKKRQQRQSTKSSTKK